MPPTPCRSVHLQGSDNADLEISHAFDADTDVKVEVSSKSMTTPSVEVSHRFVSLCVLCLNLCAFCLFLAPRQSVAIAS